jgi:hypothetical protein
MSLGNRECELWKREFGGDRYKRAGTPNGREEVTLFSILSQLGSGDQETKGVEGRTSD